ncbi:carboxypeptidase-like regulatory domain-containing protein [Chitinophaga eiseniae]|uniref:Carboxypeptidase regulatory-like domain-containing protein n=1 Tax=Chitinophaga eiseniae TaxID=634771 RepID=A0A847SSY4_9BACT|nr:carboxypeptidase-like regulatory domain-containing protein [Chitinophaga eiseniae]NLR80569.1 carboxypeptidase regulatory-like domain-containing protein [Chitinophaga eiseniae]
MNNYYPKTAGLLCLTALLWLGACKKSGNDTPDNSGSEQLAYKAVGIVKNADGSPVSGAKVRAVNPVLLDASADVFTDAKGAYITPKLDLGGWYLYAWKEQEYEGYTYHLRVAPEDDDYNPFSIDKGGKVKHFKLRLTGRIKDIPKSENMPDQGYYGGTLQFVNLGLEAFKKMPVNTPVKIILTPLPGSKLLDGSAPAVVEKTFTIAEGEDNYWITDIPQCKYIITARSGNKVIRLTDHRDIYGEEPYKNSLSWMFKPAASASYAGGLKGNSDKPFYMDLE